MFNKKYYSLGFIKIQGFFNLYLYWYNKYENLKQTHSWLAKKIKQRLISKLNYLKILLNFYQKLGYLNQQANDLLYKQVEYIINNL